MKNLVKKLWKESKKQEHVLHKEFTSPKKKLKDDLAYELIYDDKALSQLQKLPKEASTRILKKLDDTKKDPFRHFERLKTSSLYKLRVGSYRVLADIQSKLIQITVLEVDHRRRVYKRNKRS